MIKVTKSKTIRQLVKYGIVGSTGTMINLALLWLFTAFVLPPSIFLLPGYVVAEGIATLFAFLWNFTWNKLWTFGGCSQ